MFVDFVLVTGEIVWRVSDGAAADLPRVRTMDESAESKNALWRREDQLRCWNTSETNSASATPRDRQLSAVKFHDGCVFLAACSSGDTKEVAWLLGRGADINTANVDGLTALHQVSLISKPATQSRFGREARLDKPHFHTLTLGTSSVTSSALHTRLCINIGNPTSSFT